MERFQLCRGVCSFGGFFWMSFSAGILGVNCQNMTFLDYFVMYLCKKDKNSTFNIYAIKHFNQLRYYINKTV